MSSPDLTEAVPEATGAAVLNVLVIGFHHKKGCQVEYSYPPLMPGGDSRSSELPSQWKHLPALAMPDGSHNFLSDTAFFHLPALDNPRKTVFGISCYRQIDADKVNHFCPSRYVNQSIIQNHSYLVLDTIFYRYNLLKVLNKTADITRGSVQKSVCVLSRLPLYGQIQVKMALITEAYFAEGDFERVDLIHQGWNSIDNFLGPVSGPDPCPGHF